MIPPASHPADPSLIARPTLAFRIGVTGAASLDPEAQARLRPRVQQVLAQIAAGLAAAAASPRAIAAYQPNPGGMLRPQLRIVSPLGEGADRIVAAEALQHGAELEVVLPFAQPDYEASFPASIPEFQSLLLQAASVVVLDGDSGDPILRHRSYGEAGRIVARNCDLLIAIWDDGKPARGPGGTSDTVRFAVHAGTPVWWLHADGTHPPRVLTESLHLAQPDGAPAGPEAEAWLARHLADTLVPPAPGHDHAAGLLPWLAARVRAWCGLEDDPLANFLAERDRGMSVVWRIHGWLLGPPRAPADAAAPPSHPAARLSRQYQARYRSSYLYVFLLAALALVSAVLGLGHEAVEDWMAPVELLALLAIFGLVLANHVWRWHERYMSYRLLAELFRLQRQLEALGWSLPRLDVSGLATRAGRSWAGWYFAAMVRAAPLPEGVLVGERLTTRRDAMQGLVTEQAAFHQRRRHWKERAGRRLEVRGEILFGVTLALVLVKSVLLRAHIGHEMTAVLGLLAALLPAGSAALFGLRAYEEMEVLAEQSGLMLDALHAAEARLAAIRLDRPLASQVLAAEVFGVSAVMLADVNGWAQLFRMKAVGAG